jgi:16S rRNA (guanine527-N7)-methyltransferase
MTRDFEPDIARLLDLLQQSQVETRSEAAALLKGLCGQIEEWNKSVNLVSRKDIQRLVSYHFCDSASILPLLKPRTGVTMLDVGGSNGLPGLVLSAISPHISVTVCDSRLKRRAFLTEACRGLGEAAAFKMARIDNDEFRQEHSGSFDLIVARAVTRLKQLLKWCMPLLAPKGYLVAYKGSRCLEEAHQAERELVRSGGRLLAVIGSPWMEACNPLRMFAIAGRGFQ